MLQPSARIVTFGARRLKLARQSKVEQVPVATIGITYTHLAFAGTDLKV